MFCVNVWLSVKDPGNVETVRSLLAEAGRSSRMEPGCLRFEVYQSEADRTRFLLCERWQAKADWEHHKTLHAFRNIYAPKILPLVEREAHVSVPVE